MGRIPGDEKLPEAACIAPSVKSHRCTGSPDTVIALFIFWGSKIQESKLMPDKGSRLSLLMLVPLV